MKDSLITEIVQQMTPYLDNAQMMQLYKVLEHSFFPYDVSLKENSGQEDDKQNQEYLELLAKSLLLDPILSFLTVKAGIEKAMRLGRAGPD